MAETLGRFRYALLGPLKVWRDGEELDLGWARQQAVLVVLLLEMNRPVSMAALIDAVWDHDPPRNARSTVQTYVSRLRRVLRPGRASNADPGVLISTDAGYQLCGDPADLDVTAFERHLASAQEHYDREDLEAAALEGEVALALWRGEPLGGLRGPRVEAERGRLLERHCFARELRATINLERGRHTAAVSELTRLIGEFPLRERLRGLLMLALYRSGRQADALAAYHEIRELLAAELGIDPDPELRDLHERILRAEPELTDPASARSPAVADGEPSDGHRLDRAARELALAVHRQWTAEAATRSLRRPKPVRLRWSSTGRPIAAMEFAVLGEDDREPHRAEPMDLRGDLDDLVAALRRLPARQLVVLGEPGAGKTVLAILLTLGLLDDPRPDESTPVLLPVSSCTRIAIICTPGSRAGWPRSTRGWPTRRRTAPTPPRAWSAPGGSSRSWTASTRPRPPCTRPRSTRSTRRPPTAPRSCSPAAAPSTRPPSATRSCPGRPSSRSNPSGSRTPSPT